MKALFAMDLMGGKTVRLMKGDFSKVTVYSNDPVSKIEEMMKRGAKDFHIIDLDGARTGIPAHRDIIKAIGEKVTGYLEVGGGIRTREDIEYYTQAGASGVIVGTQALLDEIFFESLSEFKNIVLGLDLLDGKPMVKGWKAVAERDIKEILRAAERIGVMAILCTSVARDGMLSGPDYEGLKGMMEMTGIPVIASGGVTAIEDVKKLKNMGAWATILGKAVYEGLIRIEEVAGIC
ncbi:MAG: 1-(5-phosphoribosyl)-5-[(5-phosphoribosylamino)methylideneamino] imidazole-4-carboxamide isomerase [Syntrophobacterales bacterium]|jgi:phosphoribosylformimino-5-aminoimidazole carboxamide ribotide isomerase|nr:1-(5-phosphoribosyl)-5-[(5-phosphoribosylamino)methylideneamino] imidazole-4-carboxamide isomerase [Syntrophobacterales bacterium]